MLLSAAADSTSTCDVVNRKTDAEGLEISKRSCFFRPFFFNPHEWFQKQKATFFKSLHSGITEY